jgi:molybdopterin-guanine dinucleotide biosynthesis protein A
MGLPVYPDIMAGYGPLSGVHTALCRAAAMKVLILACDMPAVSPDFLEYMAGIKSWAPVITPESDSGLEPLHSIWHRSLIPLLEYFIASGRTGLRSILQELPCRVISKAEITEQDLDTLSLKSTNTPEALAELRKKVLSPHY